MKRGTVVDIEESQYHHRVDGIKVELDQEKALRRGVDLLNVFNDVQEGGFLNAALDDLG